MPAIGSFRARGRRLKFACGSRIVANRQAPAEYRGRLGTVIEYLGSSQYRINFDGSDREEFVPSQWVDVAGGSL
jgi:hypothetical protein